MDQRINALLDVAKKLFVENGYSGTSIDTIAALANAGKQTIYSRYSDKRTLFLEVVKRSMDSIPEEMLPPSNKGTPLELGLQRWANYVLSSALHTDFISLYKLLLAEGTRFPEISLGIL